MSQQTELFVEQLTIIDSAWFSAERGLVGDSWLVDVQLSGALNDEGMLLDFGEVKPLLKRQIDSLFDHKLLIASEQPGCQLKKTGDTLDIALNGHHELNYRLRCPSVAVQTITADSVSEAALATAIHSACLALLPKNITDLAIKVYREAESTARYHYCHGLRQHQGNCQRIAHGHRARLEIYRDGKRDAKAESDWVSDWQDIFIGSAKDLQADNPKGALSFAYTAPQGYFRLDVPERRCVVLAEQTTAECIANYIAEQLQHREPAEHWRVRVFEGAHKGAGAIRSPAQ